MKLQTLQTQYNLIKEGKGNKEIFVKEAKRIFTNIISPSAGFNETANTLKYHNIISESSNVKEQSKIDFFEIFNKNVNESKVEEKKPTKEVVDMETRGFDYKDKKNINNVYGEQFLKGFYTEMQDPKNEEKTVEELKSIVAKNLAKDRLYYVKDGQFGVKGVGYETEVPGLGTPKEAKGKYKSSGYGDLKENKLTTPQLSQLKVGDKVKYLGKDTNGFVKGEQYEVSRKESSSTFQPTITIKNKDGKKLRTSNLSKELNEETHSVGPMVKPEGFQVGDIVKYKGMNHEVTRIVDDRIYIKNLKYGGRPDTWVKAVDLKENKPGTQKSYNQEIDWIKYEVDYVPDNKEVYEKWPEPYKSKALKALEYRKRNFRDMSKDKLDSLKESYDDMYGVDGEAENEFFKQQNLLKNAPIGSKAMGGGYGPFIKISSNSWKDMKSNSLQHSRALADFIGGFDDFIINEPQDTSSSFKQSGERGGFDMRGINENDFDGTGLIVVGRTQIDNNNIGEVVDASGFYGIWNVREGYWFFPESEENLDALEQDLSELLDNVEEEINYRIEGQFNESLNENKKDMIKLLDLLEGEYYDLKKEEKKKPLKKEVKKKKTIVSDKVKEIESTGNMAALEAKINALEEEIDNREIKMRMANENEDLAEFINPVRIKEMEKEVKELQKAKDKYLKEYKKVTGEEYNGGKEIVGEIDTDDLENTSSNDDAYEKAFASMSDNE